MADAIAMSNTVLNYSGLLFDKGSAKRPLFSLISGRRMVTNNVKFVVGQYYTTPSAEAQPEISEKDSLTAPESKIYTRTQMTNVTQIFQESVYVSYAKMSNMGTLSGVNIDGQVANPQNELDFQIGRTMDYIGNQIEYTLVNGTYQESNGDDEVANKTRGIIAAITTNVIEKAGTPEARFWDIAELAGKVSAAHGDKSNLVIMAKDVHLMQLTKNAVENGMTLLNEDATTNGVAISRIKTPYGTYSMVENDYVPAGTVLMINPLVMGIVEEPVPGKGNFFYEELARTGAGIKGHVFGQLGLDHGPEWYHGKITGLKQTFTAPEQDGIRVVTVEAGEDPTV